MNFIKYLIALIILFLMGCGAGQISIKQPEQRNPINVKNENLPRITVAKITSSLIPGQVIGGHFHGLAKVKQQNYYAQGVVSSEWEEKYKEAIFSELSDAGYSVPSYSKIFGEKDNYNIRFCHQVTVNVGFQRPSIFSNKSRLAYRSRNYMIKNLMRLFIKLKPKVILNLME